MVAFCSPECDVVTFDDSYANNYERAARASSVVSAFVHLFRHDLGSLTA